MRHNRIQLLAKHLTYVVTTGNNFGIDSVIDLSGIGVEKQLKSIAWSETVFHKSMKEVQVWMNKQLTS